MFRMVAPPVALLLLATNQIAADQNTFMCVGNETLPSHCSDAVKLYSHVFQQILASFNSQSNTTTLLSNQAENVLKTGLDHCHLWWKVSGSTLEVPTQQLTLTVTRAQLKMETSAQWRYCTSKHRLKTQHTPKLCH